jgi:hypothetical protein
MREAMMPNSNALRHEPERWPKLRQEISGDARDVCLPTYDIRRFVHDGLFDEQFCYSSSPFVLVPFIEHALQI